MAEQDVAVPRTALGRVQVYLGACDLGEVRRYRELFGGVTLQGRRGLTLARELSRADDLWGVDLDLAAYTEFGAQPDSSPQMALDIDVRQPDWVEIQQALGLPVVRTAARHRIRVGRIDELRSLLDQDQSSDVRVQLALDGGWFGPRHIRSLVGELTRADRDVSLVLGAPFDPLDSGRRIAGFRSALQWAATAGRRLELLRTDLAGVAAVTDGACLASVGLGTSTRHLGLPLSQSQQHQYAQRQQSPLVFVPRLLHWQRGQVLGGLAPWRGGGVTDCDCPSCLVAGEDLLRFSAVFDDRVPPEVQAAVREHDAFALGRLVQALSASANPAAELEAMRDKALGLARSATSTYKVQLGPPPAWMTSWD